MVSLFNKWLVLVLVPVWFSLGTSPGGADARVHASGLHPLHMSVTEVDHNASAKTLEISCKLFTDDFENILEKIHKTNVDLINPTDKMAAQKMISDYITSHLGIRVDGKMMPLTCIGFEREDAALLSYFQVDNILAPKKFDYTCSLLHDLYDDQVNIIHTTVAGTRKSTKLNFPDKNASETF